jgi:hypothetical protein
VQRPASAAEKEAREEARTKQQLAEELLRLLERAARALRLKVSFQHVEGKRVYTYSRADEKRGAV